MDRNTHSADGLTALAAVVDQLAVEGRADAVRAERVLALRRLLDRLEGHWLAELAALAGAEAGVPAGSTAGWLRTRLRMGPAPPTALARRPGPCSGVPHQHRRALTAGELTPAHASGLAAGTDQLPTPRTAEAEPVLVAAARRLDPPTAAGDRPPGQPGLLCRSHHRAVHEGGWQLTRVPDGHLTATPPTRRQPTAA